MKKLIRYTKLAILVTWLTFLIVLLAMTKMETVSSIKISTQGIEIKA